MRITTAVAVVALLSVAAASAQPGSPTLHVSDPTSISMLRSLDARIDALSKQAMICVEKKLAPPDSCFCKYPAEVAALRKEYQAVVRTYPAWASRAVAWTDNSSGSLVGHTIAIAHLGPQLSKCAAK